MYCFEQKFDETAPYDCFEESEEWPMNAKEKSRAYFNAHRKSRPARGGYWRLDYGHVLAEIETLRPESLIEIPLSKLIQNQAA